MRVVCIKAGGGVCMRGCVYEAGGGVCMRVVRV